MLLGIIILILLFLFVPYAEVEPYKLKKEIITMVEQISAEIEKYEEPPPVERPKVAVAAAATEVTEEAVETITSTEFHEDIIRTQPTGPEIEIIPYARVEIKPKPLVIPKPDYPELARRAGMEGKVIVEAIVDVDGSVIDAKIFKSSGIPILDEAAIVAARRSKFTPAKQRDKFVRVRVNMPFDFRLQNP